MQVAHEKPGLVLDVSIALAWCFHDKADYFTDAIANELPHLRVVVPALWYLEVASALLAAEKRQLCTHTDVTNWLMSLRGLPITVDDDMAHAWRDTLTLAHAHNISVYEAAYLELAFRKQVPFATADERMENAARAAYIHLYGG